MHVTVTTEDDKIVTVEVDPETQVVNLKAILEAETDVPSATQCLVFNGRELTDTATLLSSGVQDGDLIMVLTRPAPGSANPGAVNPDGSAVNPSAFQTHLRGDAGLMQQLQRGNPALHAAVLNPDTSVMQRLLRESHSAREHAEARRNAEIDLLNADPFDAEAQRKIEESIRLRNVDANYETAMETTPEAFGSVIMLYVDVKVNDHPIKAFVDSGAQMTIMSLGCAQRLGLERLIDRRFRGVAKGVGTQQIIGKVHQAPITIADVLMPCAITVLEKEQDMDFIFGLDMLRRHQCCIDLEGNFLKIGTIEKCVPFLGEHELPSFAKPREEDEAPGEAAGEAPREAPPQGTTSDRADRADRADHADRARGTVPLHTTRMEEPSAPGGGGGGSGSGSGVESKIAKLIELGFDRAKCIEALDASGGNEEYAASLLFSGF
jgi:DNA damage-inducible protein 1